MSGPRYWRTGGGPQSRRRTSRRELGKGSSVVRREEGMRRSLRGTGVVAGVGEVKRQLRDLRKATKLEENNEARVEAQRQCRKWWSHAGGKVVGIGQEHRDNFR